MFGRFTTEDMDLLKALANQSAVALENAAWSQTLEHKVSERTSELQASMAATEQRAAELSVINSIQQGLAAELDFQAIIDLVGDKLREVLHTEEISIRWYDKSVNLLHYVYTYEHGKRIHVDSMPPMMPAWFMVYETRQPLVLNTLEELNKMSGNVIPGTDVSLCMITVPIIGSDRVIGSISIENYEREYAFSESDVRLLQTVASSMGVALENARLFEETQKLLSETEQRNSELAVINSIQLGLASELDFQSIINLVGDKLREVLKYPDMGIGWYDEKTNLIHYLYGYEHNVRLENISVPPTRGGMFEEILRTRQPVVINNSEDWSHYNIPTMAGTDKSKSTASIPIITGDRVVGFIGVDNFEIENAFSEAEVRLISTIAGSLGAALQNANLFDETQRLFKAEQERVAELQIINSIQEGLASKLDFQSIVDLVGDKVREVFETRDLTITWYDHQNNLAHVLYIYEHGKRLTLDPLPFVQGGLREKLFDTRKPIIWNTENEGDTISPTVPGTDSSKSGVVVPIISSDTVIGAMNLENFERENAYGEAEIRLLTTIAGSLGAALQNANLFDETQRLLRETEQRNSELAVINSIQEGLASELDFQAIVDLVGDKLREVLTFPDMMIGWYGSNENLIHYLYGYEHGIRLEPLSQPPAKGGMFEMVLKTHQPVVINNAEDASHYNIPVIPGTDISKSSATIPIISNDRVLGFIGMDDLHENAFGESEIRLVTTIAGSLGAALLNANLFDETQHLLK